MFQPKSSINQKQLEEFGTKSRKQTSGRWDRETQEHHDKTEQEQEPEQEMHDKQNRWTDKEKGRQGLKFTRGVLLIEHRWGGKLVGNRQREETKSKTWNLRTEKEITVPQTQSMTPIYIGKTHNME